MFTLDAQMRQVLLTDAHNSRTALAAALEAKLAQTACDACTLGAILGEARTSSQLLDTFRSLIESGRAAGGGASERPPTVTPIVVRVGDSSMPEGEDRPEAVALSRDVHEVATSSRAREQLADLGNMTHDTNALFWRASAAQTGAPLRRLLETLQDTILAKALVHHQVPDALVQTIQQVRAALARRGSGPHPTIAWWFGDG